MLFASSHPSAALLALLELTGTRLEGARAVVIGRGRVVGLPVALMLIHRHATVCVAHSRTRAADLESMVRDADIVVAAAGKPELVRGEWIKPGAVVLDVGITREAQGALQGDVQFIEAAKVCTKQSLVTASLFDSKRRISHLCQVVSVP